MAANIEDEIARALARSATLDPTLRAADWRTSGGHLRRALSDASGCYALIDGEARVDMRDASELVAWIVKEVVADHVASRIDALALVGRYAIDFRQKQSVALIEAATPGWSHRRNAWITSKEVVARHARRVAALATPPRATSFDPSRPEGRQIEAVVDAIVALSGAPGGWRERGDGAVGIDVRPSGYVVHYNGRDGSRDEGTYPTRDAIVRALAGDALREVHDVHRLEQLFALVRPAWFDDPKKR